jgi:hypothetical protein
METTMRKIALTIFGALLISGSVVQMAAATEHHKHVTKANLARHHSDLRGAYNQVSGPINVSNVSVTPRAAYSTVEWFRLPDPSWVGDEDPSLRPSD